MFDYLLMAVMITVNGPKVEAKSTPMLEFETQMECDRANDLTNKLNRRLKESGFDNKILITLCERRKPNFGRVVTLGGDRVLASTGIDQR